MVVRKIAMAKKSKIAVALLGIIVCLAAAIIGIHYISRPGKAFISEKNGLNYMHSQWEVLMESADTAWDTSWNASIRSAPSNRVVRQKLLLSLSDLRKAENELHLLFENHYAEFSPANQAILQQILEDSLVSVHTRKEAIEAVLTIQDDNIYLFEVIKNMPDVNLQGEHYRKTALKQWEKLKP